MTASRCRVVEFLERKRYLDDENIRKISFAPDMNSFSRFSKAGNDDVVISCS